MTVFVSYIKGAKGKFVTEICDLSTLPYNNSPLDNHGGNVKWSSDSMMDFLQKNDINRYNIHGLHPEPTYYKNYIDAVLQGVKTLNLQNAIDTHYTRKETLEYILAKGEKVIRIVVTDIEYFSKLQLNFFFKNFISPNTFKNDPIEISNHAGMVIKNNKLLLEKDFNYNLIGKPLMTWDKDSLKMLFDACGFKYKKPQQPNIISHNNLLEVNVKDLSSVEALTEIIEFAEGAMNNIVTERINRYNLSQEQISTFDECIDDFLKYKGSMG